MKRNAVFQKAVPYFPQLQGAFGGEGQPGAPKPPVPEDGADPGRPNGQRTGHKEPGPTPKPSLGVATNPATAGKPPGPKGNLISIPRAVVPLPKKAEQPAVAKPPAVQINVQKQQIALPKPSGPGTKKSEDTKQPITAESFTKPSALPTGPAKFPVSAKPPSTNEASARSIPSLTNLQKHSVPTPELNGAQAK